MKVPTNVTTLAREALGNADSALAKLPEIDLRGGTIDRLFTDGSSQVERLLPDYLAQQRWFAGKARTIESVGIRDHTALGAAPGPDQIDARRAQLAMLDVRYADGPSEVYAHAFAVRRPTAMQGGEGDALAPFARVHAADGEWVLADAMTTDEMSRGIMSLMSQPGDHPTAAGRLAGSGGPALDDAFRSLEQLDVTPLSLHTSNTSVRVDGSDASAALKLVRRHDGELAPGTPTRALDVWKGAWLTNHTDFANTPRVYGSIDHVDADGAERTIAVLSEFAANDGDSWTHALGEARATVEAARASGIDAPDVAAGVERYAAAARNHGQRLGELHIALSSGGSTTEFRAVAPTAQELATRTAKDLTDARQTVTNLRQASETGRLDASVQHVDLDALESGLDARLKAFHERTWSGDVPELIHTHGDFHLGQMLKTGDDVMIIDLEGAPALPIAERWKRADALGDVARQRSSYEYAAEQTLRALADQDVPAGELATLRPVAERWATAAREAFVDGWRSATQGRSFVPADADLEPALRHADLTNALYETSYELSSRPDWAGIPLGRLERLVRS